MICLKVEDNHFVDAMYDIGHAFETGDSKPFYDGLTLLYTHGEKSECIAS